jgi:hypothetical protein
METVLKVFVLIVQLALGGFVRWGATLSFRAWLAELLSARAARAASAPARPIVRAPSHADFGRAASLVLLALLCTTLAGLP